MPLLLGICTNDSWSQRLTLEEAIEGALEASEELRISREEVRGAVLMANEAGAQRLPRLDLSGQYIFTSEVMTMVQPPTTVPLAVGSVTVPGREMAFGDEHAVDFKLQVTQPLFTGFAIQKAGRASRREALVQKTEWERTRREIRCKAEEAYIRTQKAAALAEAVQLQVNTLERHLADARRRVEEGVAPLEIAARAEFALQQARLERQEAEHRRHLAEIALRELLDMPEDGEALQLDSLEFVPQDRAIWDVDYAMTHRLEFEALRFHQEAAAERIGVQQAAYYPSLYAFGSLNYGRPGVDRLANEWMLYQTAGVTLNWTLWDWNIRRSRTQQARVVHRQLDESLRALQSRVRQEVRGAELAVEDALQRIEVAQEGLQLSIDIQRWVSERYGQGAATEAEYLDAQDDHTQSRIQNILAVADYRLAMVALKRACGGEQG